MRRQWIGGAAALIAAFSATAAATEGWPEFRGPWADGRVTAAGDPPSGLPTVWSETQNVAWKTEVPCCGWSTPVIQGNDVWMTWATEAGTEFYVLCVEKDTGKIRINDRLFTSDSPEPLGNEVNGYASPSPVIEPGRVYVHFGSYGTACLDTQTGKPIWTRTDLPCRHYRGPGSSPILFGDYLILTFDGADQQYTAALDKKTGKTIWRTDRSTKYTDVDEQGNVQREGDFRKGFSTPIVADANGTPVLISAGSMSIFGYDARTGKELWSMPTPGHTPAPRPVFGEGLAYLINGRGPTELYAVRIDGTGDITNSHVAWKTAEKILPSEPSPILIDGLLYLVSNNGLVSCLEAATGAIVWSERIGGNFMASPIYADGNLYFSSMQGKTNVLKAGRTFQPVAENVLDDGLMASPAAAGKALFLRTKTHLYRIENAGNP